DKPSGSRFREWRLSRGPQPPATSIGHRQLTPPTPLRQPTPPAHSASSLRQLAPPTHTAKHEVEVESPTDS
ncbi:MAG: hypothetical protein ACK5F7_04710, partial [Planctomycetaceae bacterium]